MHHRIAPNPEQAYFIHKLSMGALAQETIPVMVFSFLASQGLVSVRPTLGGENLVELTATGHIEHYSTSQFWRQRYE